MKLIKEGDLNNTIWKKEFTCTGEGNGGFGCRAILEVDERDMYITKRYDYTGDYETCITFMCPCCNRETDIKYSDFPSSKLNLVPEKKTWLKRNKGENNNESNR